MSTLLRGTDTLRSNHWPLSLSHPLLLFGSGWIELLPLLYALPYSAELTAARLLPQAVLNLILPREHDSGCDLLFLMQDKQLFLGHGQRVVCTPRHCYTYSIHIPVAGFDRLITLPNEIFSPQAEILICPAYTSGPPYRCKVGSKVK